MDNLLVVHYLLEQISTVIDVRKDSGMHIIFGAPRSVSFTIEELMLNDLLNFSNFVDQKQIDVTFGLIQRCTKKLMPLITP